MKKALERVLNVTFVVMLFLSACTPTSTPPPATSGAQPTQPQATLASTEPAPPTDTPVLVTVIVTAAGDVIPSTATADATAAAPTQEGAQVEPTPTLVSVAMAAPEMVVGSEYMYVDGSGLVPVPQGDFIMGNGQPDAPVRTVYLDDFWIYRYEVSNRQYALCVSLGICKSPDPKINPYFDPIFNPGYRNPKNANDPVTGVTWEQAEAYCAMVKGRLPTEAEWEKTARGPEGNMFPWGKANPTCDLANIGRCNPSVTKINGFPQGQSYYEAFNMAGNVFEWMADWYSDKYYSAAPTQNPTGPETGSSRSVRSASYTQDSYLAESARRFRFKPTEARNDLGFRCVIEDPLAFAPWCQMVATVSVDDGSGAPADVAVPTPSCPAVNVSGGGFCDTNANPKHPAANLNFSPDVLPAGTIITYPAGCSLNSTTADPNDYYCLSGGVASVQAVCTVPPAPVPAGCPAGYVQNGNTCEYTGGSPTDSTACLPGSTYDPVAQCCVALETTSGSFALCPPEAPYYSGGVCVPWPSSDYGPLITYNVTLGSCGGGGGNNNNGGGNNNNNACEPQSCSVGVWDPDLCCCSRTPGVCDGQ